MQIRWYVPVLLSAFCQNCRHHETLIDTMSVLIARAVISFKEASLTCYHWMLIRTNLWRWKMQRSYSVNSKNSIELIVLVSFCCTRQHPFFMLYLYISSVIPSSVILRIFLPQGFFWWGCILFIKASAFWVNHEDTFLHISLKP